MSNDPNTRHVGGNEYAPRYDAPYAGRSGAGPDAPPPSARPLPPEYRQPEPVQAPYAPPQAASVAATAAAAGSPVAAPASDEVVLTKPYMAHGEPVSRLRLRKPLAKEIGKIGNPIRFETGDDGRIVDIEARWDRVMKYIVVLSDPPLPPSTVEQFEYADLDSCAAVIAPFFLPRTS